jgi:ABC-type glycerol-3-phosphate transport system permease component
MGMEDDARGFFVLIINSIAVTLIWMIANVLFGIYMGYAFYADSPGWQNIIYYLISLVTFILLIRYLRSKWKV